MKKYANITVVFLGIFCLALLLTGVAKPSVLDESLLLIAVIISSLAEAFND